MTGSISWSYKRDIKDIPTLDFWSLHFQFPSSRVRLISTPYCANASRCSNTGYLFSLSLSRSLACSLACSLFGMGEKNPSLDTSPHKSIVYPDNIGIVLYIQDVFAGLYLCNASPPTHRKERHTYPWYQHQHRCGIVEPHSHSLSSKPTMDAREMKVRDVYGERHQLAFNEPGMIERNEYVSVYMRKRERERNACKVSQDPA